MISEQLKEKLKKIKILIMDVDGTLTDSAMYYNEHGEVMKRFSTRDGMGVTLLRINSIKTAIITSENSPIARARAKKLQVDHIILGSKNKKKIVKELIDKLDFDISEVAYIGDDLNDIEPVKYCGFSVCPLDAVEQIKNNCDFISSYPGGNGAVRELAEMILEAKNIKLELPDNW